MIVVLAAKAGTSAPVLVLFGLATLAGEVSIGWSNDAFDAARDAAAGRTDKPIVTGQVSRRTVFIAGATALAISVVACYALNATAGTLNVIMMAAGWAYNAGLKSTLSSGIMYIVGFGLIPAFAASVAPGPPASSWWTLLAAALLGLGAHFANVLPDLAADKATDVRGTPQRLAESAGPVAVRLTALTLLLGASVLVVLAPGAPYRWEDLAVLGLAAALAVAGAVSRGRLPFLAAIAIAALDVALFVFGDVAPAQL
jgi:4-hydroxybenzoate polyprenyltransferase